MNNLDQVYSALSNKLDAVEVRLNNKLSGLDSGPTNIMPGPSAGGELMKYYRDIKEVVRRGGLKFARIESIDFTCQATAAVVPVLTQPAASRVDDGYIFALRRIYGFFSAPATNPADIANISYQVREEGTARDLFRTRQPLAYLIGGAGTSNSPLEFEGVYIFSQGADIRVDFAVAQIPIAYSGATAKSFGISLVGDMYSMIL